MTDLMTSFGYKNNHDDPIQLEGCLPSPLGHDLLVAIEAIAVNPVDTKVKAAIKGELSEAKVIGWDAAGTVIATGADCNLFKVGDRVFYAGDVTRVGCYASHQLVDERISGRAPKTLGASESAAMALTSITAWEALFSRMKIHPDQDQGKTLLIIGGAGGVGSIAIQLAKKIAHLNVVASASRKVSANWCRQLGADHIVDHSKPLADAYRQLDIPDPDYILCLHDADFYFDEMAALVAAQGMLCIVTTTQKNHDLNGLKNKSAGLVWEFMFTRSMFNTADLILQHQILNRIADLLDQGILQHTLSETLGPISVETINQAHHQLLTGNTLGKIALTAMLI